MDYDNVLNVPARVPLAKIFVDSRNLKRLVDC
jgi:hypothetical protein